MRTVVSILASLLLVATFFAQPADAQILKRVKERAKEQIETKAAETKEQVIDVVMEEEPVDDPADERQVAEVTPKTASDPPQKAPVRPGEGAWANFDFVPGERILFAEDFSRDRIGNFPQRLEFLSGNAEVVQWNDKRWLRVNDETYFKIPLPENLPSRFTVEFDITVPWWGMDFHADVYADERYNSHSFTTSGAVLGCCEAGIYRGQGDATSTVDPRNFFADMFEDALSEPLRARMQVDGSYIKMYLNEHRVANMPNGNFGRANYIAFRFSRNGSAEDSPLIGNISVNAGGTPMYEALMADGRFATQGILFDTGSDRIRPESSPTLQEIGDMLRQYADIRLMIEGHTDNVGSENSNQTLSEKRATAVRSMLVETYGVDAGRLESKGLGQSQPTASNDTSEGRQQNRRVELVKL
jgi:OmpA-OmpF porin, OOP family